MRLAVLSVHCTSTQLMPIGGQSVSYVVSMTIATLAPAITKPIAPTSGSSLLLVLLLWWVCPRYI